MDILYEVNSMVNIDFNVSYTVWVTVHIISHDKIILNKNLMK